MLNPLYDKDFLKKLDTQLNQEKYVKIIALDFNDLPKETIEGKITNGSINVDGASAVRRTCSLTLVAPLEEDPVITDPYWCFNTKINIQIGVKNNTNTNYPDIIWFDMGIYLLSSFSISHSTNALTVSLSGKDKMCRLNGEMGGIMPAQWDWGAEEYMDYESDTVTITKIPLKTIVYNIVREFAHEKPENIIINDLDSYGYELWEYAGDSPMYYFRDIEQKNIHQVSFEQQTKITTKDLIETTVSELEKQSNGKYYSTNTLDPKYNQDASEIVLGHVDSEKYDSAKYKYNLVRISYGETAGYHQIPLVFNSDLIAKAGETATSVLDKIKDMLGNYEYFYNLKGQFVFQKKNDYVQELYSTSTGALTTPSIFNDMYSYRFEDETQFTTVSIQPNLNNIKNDFIVWGVRPIGQAPLHARCAIDTKPTIYTSPWERMQRVGDIMEVPMRDKVEGYYYRDAGEYKTGIYNDNQYNGNEVINTIMYDFSALSQSSLKSYKLIEYKNKETYYTTDANNLDYGKECWYVVIGNFIPETLKVAINICYYNAETDALIEEKNETWSVGDTLTLLNKYNKNLYVKLNPNRTYTIEDYDWRELIYQMAIDYRKHGTDPDYYTLLEQYNPKFINGCTGYENYYIDMEGFWRQLYNPTSDNGEEVYHEGNMIYWNKKIHSDPNSLLFWFELFDTESELKQYSVQNIGHRQKLINENTVTSVYHKDVPEVQLYVVGEDWEKEVNTSYTPIQITPEDELLFYRSAQGASAIGRINDLMYNHLSTIDSINITSIPIYYLQPNTRIYVANKGDYTISKLSYNLSYNGTMNISGSKIYKQWY